MLKVASSCAPSRAIPDRCARLPFRPKAITWPRAVTTRRSASGRRISSGSHGVPHVRGKYLLQHLPFDWLLQNRHFLETAVDAIGVVAGDEDERHTASRQDFCNPVHRAVAKINIEDSGVEMSVAGGRQCLRRSANRTGNAESEFTQAFLDHNADQRLVLDQKHAGPVAPVQRNHRAAIFALAARNITIEALEALRQRDRYFAVQPLGVPVKMRLPAKLLLDAG